MFLDASVCDTGESFALVEVLLASAVLHTGINATDRASTGRRHTRRSGGKS